MTRIERLRPAVEALRAEGCDVYEQWALRLTFVDGSGYQDHAWGSRDRALSMIGRQWAEIGKRGPEGVNVHPSLIRRLEQERRVARLTPAEHHAEAKRLLAWTYAGGRSHADQRYLLALAQLHATLALYRDVGPDVGGWSS